MFHRSHGSVRLRDQKRAARQEITTPERAPKYVILPIEPHGGEPCEPVVSVGEHVLLGQMAARPAGAAGVPIHAPISGTVSAIEPCPCPDGTFVTSVVIENDFQNTPAPALERKAEPENLTGWEIAALITQAGIPCGPALKAAIGKADTLIVDGTEDEPYITADHRLMLDDSERLLGGVGILMRALTLQKAVIAVAGNKLDAAEHLRAQLPKDSGIRVAVLRTRYPQNTAAQLIPALTGRRVPVGGSPADAQCAVCSAADAAAVYDAVIHGLPLTQRVVTVSGGAVRQSRNLRVPIGTPLSCLPAECGGLAREPVRVLVGGPMTGAAQRDLSAPVMKDTRALLLLTREECAPTPDKASPCIRCGRCVKACPLRLTPFLFDQYRKKGRISDLEALHISDCTECGCCAYVCPAHIPLVQSIRGGKAALEAARKEAGQ